MTSWAINRHAREIAVYHGGLDRPWRSRIDAIGAASCRSVERVIRSSTGLRRVQRRFCNNCMVFHLRSEIFAPAAVAVRLTHGPPDALI
jgi:hypothetical protein